MPGRRLTASERVRRRPDFERVYSQGVKIHAQFMTVFMLSTGGAVGRLGVAATRKLGSAVARNRAKRLAREIFRHHKVAAGLDVVIVPRVEMLDASFASLERDFCAAIERRTNSRGRPRHRPSRRPARA